MLAYAAAKAVSAAATASSAAATAAAATSEDAPEDARGAAGQIGHEGLRATELRLPDGGDERRHDRDLHRGRSLKATSRGGLMPRTSNGTCRRRRRRTSSAARG